MIHLFIEIRPTFKNITSIIVWYIPFNSFRCSKIASKIHKILNTYTPNFRLHIAFSTIKLSSIILPLLKPQKPYLHNANVVYKFTCPWSLTYIGETYRLLDSRILEHRRDTPSHIYLHIDKCSHYKNSLTELYGDQPSDLQKREFFRPLFTIIERNISKNYARKIFEGRW